jgi:hypothetical protein
MEICSAAQDLAVVTWLSSLRYSEVCCWVFVVARDPTYAFPKHFGEVYNNQTPFDEDV